MANVEKMSISLSRDMVADIKDAIDRGQYATASEVMRDAMRDWQRKQKAPLGPAMPGTVAELRKMIQEGIDSGPSLDPKLVLARLKAKYGGQANGQTKTRKAGQSRSKRSR